MSLEITDEDRKLIQRWNASTYLADDEMQPRIDAERFRLRQDMRRLGIKVTNVGSDQFAATVRGAELTVECNAEMAQLRAEMLLREIAAE